MDISQVQPAAPQEITSNSTPNHTVDPKTGYLESNGFPDAFDAPQKILFLNTYRDKGLNLFQACKDMGISRHTVRHHMRIDPSFRADVESLTEEYADSLEWVSRQQAMNPGKGFMDRCMQLRHLRPSKYAQDKIQSPQPVVIQISAPDGFTAKRRNVIDAKVLDDESEAEGRRLDVSASANYPELQEATDQPERENQ